MTNFALIFGLALLLNCAVTFRSSEYWKKLQQGGSTTVSGGEAFLSLSSDADKSTDPTATAEKKRWQALLRRYLVVYLLATLSDWLQGPYVYALYDDYGFSQHDIAVLFVAGFGSSMIFGSFIGGMADWAGRRTFVIVYAVVYALSCITKRTFFL
jgi:predicted MFS family arabinose efflux permease